MICSRSVCTMPLAANDRKIRSEASDQYIDSDKHPELPQTNDDDSSSKLHPEKPDSSKTGAPIESQSFPSIPVILYLIISLFMLNFAIVIYGDIRISDELTAVRGNQKLVLESVEKLAAFITEQNPMFVAQNSELLQQMQTNEQKRAKDFKKLDRTVTSSCRLPSFPITELSNAMATHMLIDKPSFKITLGDPITKETFIVHFGHQFKVSEFAEYATDQFYESPVMSFRHNNIIRKFKLTLTPDDSRAGFSDFLGVYLWYVDGPEEKLRLSFELYALTEEGKKSILTDDLEFGKQNGFGTGHLPRSGTELAKKGYLTEHQTIFHLFAQFSFSLEE